MSLRSWTAAILVGLALPMTLHGQVRQKISGRVIDVDGKAIAHADVSSLWRADGDKIQRITGVQTDQQGNFSLPSLAAFGNAVMALDKERKNGGLVMVNGQVPSLVVKVQPLIKVHGSLFCKELNKRPDKTSVSIYAQSTSVPAIWSLRPMSAQEVIYLKPNPLRLLQGSAKDGVFSLLLPAGVYKFQAHGEQVQDVERMLTLSASRADLDLKTLDMPATLLASHVGKTLPPWKVTDARGAKKEVQISDFKGKWVLVTFWVASMSHFPGLIDLYETRAKDRDKFQIIAFHDPTTKNFKELDERYKKLKEMYFPGRDLPFPVLLDSTGETFKKFGIRRFPTNILVDPEGKLVGEAWEEQLEDKLPELPMPIRLANALDKNVGFYFDNPALEHAVQTLSKMARIPIRLDKEKLKDVGIAADAKIPITINTQNGFMSLRSELNLVLDAFELGYNQNEQGLLVGPRKIGTARDKLSERQRAASKRIEKMLDQKVAFNFNNQSLAYVANYFTLRTREIFVLEPADRRAGLLNPNTLVSGSANGVPLRQALESLLAPVRASFVVRDEAVVLTFKPRVPPGN
jgi:hypothetical protein